MTQQRTLPIDDARIERMLTKRAGREVPASLVADIMATAAATPQSRGWFGPRVPHLDRGTRTLLVAAAVVLAIVTTILAVGSDRRNVVLPPVPPATSPSPSPSPTAAPTPAATPSASEAASPSASLPAVAPRDDYGPLIVYRRGASQIDLFTLDAFTGDRVGTGTLQRGAAVAGQHIEWAADRGSAFVYADSDSLSARIDVADRSVAALVGLPPSGSTDSVSPSGDMVARLTDDNDLAILDLNGDPITTIDLPNGIQPILRVRWSPDSSTVAVSSCLPCGDKGEPVPWHVFLAPIDGSPVRQLGDLSVGYIGIDDWSSDGRRLLLSDTSCADDPCTGGLLVMDAATGTAARLTSTGEGDGVFSPDGSRVAYIDGLFGSRIAVRSTDDASGGGHAVVTVPDGSSTLLGDLIWSPNGDWILYRLEPVVGNEQTGIGDLWMVPSAGGEPRLVIKNAIADW